MSARIFSFFFICLTISSVPTLADDFTWTGGGGNGNWNLAANWQNDTPGGTATFPDGDDNVAFALDATVSGGAALGLSNSATVTIGNGNIVSVGADISNSGTLTYVEPGGFAERLRLTADLAINGTGELVMRSTGESFIDGDVVGRTLTNGAEHTIRGSGTISTSLVNLGDVSVQGGLLRLFGDSVNNAAGQISVGGMAGLELGGTTVISGGTLNVAPIVGALGSTIGGGGLKDLTINGGLLILRNGTITTLEGNIANNATLTYVPPGGFAERYRLVGDTTLSGSGRLEMQSAGESVLDSIDGPHTLTNGANHTIVGTGTVTVDIVNQGQITASGGTLRLLGAVENSLGDIRGALGGGLELGGVVTGGTLSPSTVGTPLSGGGLKDVTITDGRFVQGNSTITTLEGQIVNNGRLTYVQPGGFAERYRLAGDTSLAGSGQLVMQSTGESILDTLDDAFVLTNGPVHTIRGQGVVTPTIVNNGTIRPIGGTLRLTGIGGVNNNAGSIEFGPGGRLDLGGVVTGGQITATPLGNLISGGGLKDVAIIGGTLIQANSTITTLAGTITNDGTLTYVQPAGFAERYRLAESTTLAGSGELVMRSSGESILDTLDGTQVLTNGPNHTIRGRGNAPVDVINQGTISPAGGNLRLTGAGGINNEGGTIRFETLGSLTLAGVVSSGSIEATAAGNQIGGGGLEDLTITSGKLILANSSTTTVSGTITNNGTLTYVPAAGFGERFRLTSDTTLDGTGELIMQSRGESFIDTATGAEILTNGVDHTVRGNGFINASVVNHGTFNPAADLDIAGNYTESDSSTFLVNNLKLTDWSELAVSQTAAIDGELVIDYLGVIPVGTISIDVLRALEITGTYDSLTVVDSLPWVGGATFEVLADEFGNTDVVRLTITNSASGVAGDYNNDGTVDAADYTVWRDHLGLAVDMPNDTTLGTVTADDYGVWKSNYGNSVGAGAAVPEPSAIALLLAGLLAGCSRRR